jgi:hypothetical protein
VPSFPDHPRLSIPTPPGRNDNPHLLVDGVDLLEVCRRQEVRLAANPVAGVDDEITDCPACLVNQKVVDMADPTSVASI